MTDWLLPSGVFVCVVGLVALNWRQTLTLGKLAGVNRRAQDRERHDMYQLLERMMEKRDAKDGLEIGHLHRIERLEQNRLDARVEEAAETPPPPPVKPEDEFCSPEHYEN